jgi:hypothetical protein
MPRRQSSRQQQRRRRLAATRKRGLDATSEDDNDEEYETEEEDDEEEDDDENEEENDRVTVEENKEETPEKGIGKCLNCLLNKKNVVILWSSCYSHKLRNLDRIHIFFSPFEFSSSLFMGSSILPTFPILPATFFLII